MSHCDTLLNKMRHSPARVRFSDVEALLRCEGFTKDLRKAPGLIHAVTREVHVVHTWHLTRSVKKYRTRRQGTASSPVMPRCPYPDVLRSNLRYETLGTMF